jgi:signal transduction histidine kinase
VLAESAATTALYANSFLGPELDGELLDGPIDADLVARLDNLLAPDRLGDRIVSFKLWGPNGVVRYARDHELIGESFGLNSELAEAFDGNVVTGISDLSEAENSYEATRWSSLVEIYAPVRSGESGTVIAAAEFYELPDQLLAEVRDAQRTAWLLVAGATVMMFLLLNGMVRGASSTIRTQNVRLGNLTERLRKTSAENVVTTEAISHRLSQQLHDGPVQHLALANLRVEAVQQATRGTAAAADVDRIAEAIERALEGLRNASAEMRQPELEGSSVAEIINGAASYHEHRSGEPVEVLGHPPEFVPNGPMGLALYRVITEALNNATLHAGPCRKIIEADHEDGEVRVRVTDDGSGFTTETIPEGLGLRGIRERIELLGGSLEIRSSEGNGTTVNCVLPMRSL